MSQFDLPEPQDDGLIIPEVGPWSRDKHHFLRRYLDAFTTSMKDKPWASLHYVDLFAGAGIERLVEDEKQYGFDWGSPLIAAQVRTKFNRLHLVELEGKKFDALSKRIARFEHRQPPQLVSGDANTAVTEVLSAIPPKSLSVAFLDPYGLHLHFNTLQALSTRRMDLIIFFPDHTDALRNWRLLYEDNPDSNLDKVLGSPQWREAKKKTSPEGWPDMLTQFYKRRIGTLGYTYFDYERICRTDGRALYKLIFCSKSSAGGTIWKNIALQKPGGQRSFGF